MNNVDNIIESKTPRKEVSDLEPTRILNLFSSCEILCKNRFLIKDLGLEYLSEIEQDYLMMKDIKYDIFKSVYNIYGELFDAVFSNKNISDPHRKGFNDLSSLIETITIQKKEFDNIEEKLKWDGYLDFINRLSLATLVNLYQGMSGQVFASEEIRKEAALYSYYYLLPLKKGKIEDKDVLALYEHSYMLSDKILKEIKKSSCMSSFQKAVNAGVIFGLTSIENYVKKHNKISKSLQIP